MKTEINEPCIDVCNSLLRGELSAVETYNQAIEKFSSSHECGELIRFHDEHARSVGQLRTNVIEMRGTPSTESGAWGVFAKSVQGTANFLGDDSAISALQRGQEHGRNEYQEALDNDDVMPSCKEMIRNELLPKISEPIGALENLED